MGRRKIDKKGYEMLADEFANMARDFLLANLGSIKVEGMDRCPVCGRKRTRTTSEQEKVRLKERSKVACAAHTRKAAERRKMKEEGGKSLEG